MKSPLPGVRWSARTRLGLALIAVAAAVFAWSFVSSRGAGVAVRIAEVHAGPFAAKLPETGILQRPRIQVIPALAGGNLKRLVAKAGDRVRRGQLLATIDNAQLINNLAEARAAYEAARAKALTASETNRVLPAQNRSSIVQAEAAVVLARTALAQAKQDSAAGAQSALSGGASSAEEQVLTADSAVAKAESELYDAQRTYQANVQLYAEKALSRDALDQSAAHYQQAKVSTEEIRRQRQLLDGTLRHTKAYLTDRVKAERDSYLQALAALDAARANASESRDGDVEAAQSEVERTKSDFDFARLQVAHLKIRAPAAGVIQSVATESTDSLRPIVPGDSVTLGQTLFTIASSNAFVVRTKVDEQDVAQLHPGQHAIVGGEDLGDTKLTGKIVSISPIAQKSDDTSSSSRQVLTTVKLDKALPFLRDGMSVDVDLLTSESSSALIVPNEAVRSEDGRHHVFVVSNGHAQSVEVEAGPSSDTMTVIKSGLHDGDLVVADPNPAVADGTAVRPLAPDAAQAQNR